MKSVNLISKFFKNSGLHLVTPSNKLVEYEDQRKAICLSSLILFVLAGLALLVIYDLAGILFVSNEDIYFSFLAVDFIVMGIVSVLYGISRTQHYRISGISFVLLLFAYAFSEAIIETNDYSQLVFLMLLLLVIVTIAGLIFSTRNSAIIAFLGLCWYFFLMFIDSGIGLDLFFFSGLGLAALFALVIFGNYYYHEQLQRLTVSQQKARLQRDEMDALVSALKHDFNADFLSLDGLIDVLQVEHKEEYIGRIKETLQRMQKMLQHSVALARAGKIAEINEKVDLNSLVYAVAEVVVPSNVIFLAETLPTVYGDSQKLYLVFQNLFENAILHGGPDRIEITRREANDKFEILVSNNGKSIAPEIAKNLFQGKISTKREHGLGLTIAHKIIMAHGWDIWLVDKE
ncbi:MAG: sensor histidine kinase, partial [Candidatus Hodarchaeales archaeon]